MTPTDAALLDMPAVERVRLLADWLQTLRLQISNEKQAQLDLERACRAQRLSFLREAMLEDGISVPDFVIHGIAVELKVKGGVMDIYRQVERYAANDSVCGVVLATSSTMQLPASVNGKPARRASLSAGWL